MPDSFLSELDLGDGTNRKLRDRIAVSTEPSQGLTDTQKANARSNIGASLNFVGTEAQWNALSAAEQAKYDSRDIY